MNKQMTKANMVQVLKFHGRFLIPDEMKDYIKIIIEHKKHTNIIINTDRLTTRKISHC